MDMPSYFIDFLAAIRPTESQTRQMSKAHTELQKRLQADEKLKPLVVNTFIQGSYRRHTALKACNGERCDVDVVVVTRFDKKVVPPQAALNAFVPFLEEHYRDKYEPQGRSWGITVNETVKLDLVPTAAPSESMLRLFEGRTIGPWFERGEQLFNERQRPEVDPIVEALRSLRAKDEKWMLEPLDIPDREAQKWDQTHPLAQIDWTVEKNGRTNGHYINVVKAVKWWRREHEPRPKYPKSYPLEHLLGENSPDGTKGVAIGIVRSLENALTRYAPDVAAGRVPYLHDHGFPPEERTHNVMGRVSPDDFAGFYAKMKKAAGVARKALDCTSMHESSKLWQELFGDEFPEAPPDAGGDDDGGSGGKGGFTPRKDVSVVSTSRFG
jgi:hypothetical protein